MLLSFAFVILLLRNTSQISRNQTIMHDVDQCHYSIDVTIVTQRTLNSSVTIIAMIIILPMSACRVNLIRQFGVIVISPRFHHPSDDIPLLYCSERYFPLCLHFLLQCAEFFHCILFWSLKTVNILSNNCEQKDKTSSFTGTFCLRHL